jgi:pyruvate formate lyase activating enzyme
VIQDGTPVYFREKCVVCGKCTETCYAGALVLTGKLMTVDEVIEEVLRDRIFYEVSKGGVTLSGGEPLVQQIFSLSILERCRAEGLHTAIETAANCCWNDLAMLLPATDLIMMDIKHLNSDKHLKVTGVPNELILENARRLAQTGKPLIIRVPVVLTVNDSQENIEAIAQFVQSFPNLQYLELLPFHHLGEGKYHALGLDYRAAHLKTPEKDGKIKELLTAARRFGIEVRVG